MLIDTHAHLFWDSYKDDLDEVIQRSLEAGVSTVINVGVDTHLSQVAAELDNDQVKFYSAIGIHPHEAAKYANDPQSLISADILLLEQLFAHHPKKITAVGECGLDFLFESNPDFIPTYLSISQAKDLQKQLFQAQIDLAKKLNLPLLVHIRDDRSQNPENVECWEEALDLVKDWKGILHCYSGTMAITQKIPSNFLVSFAGNLTYPKNDYLREAAKFLPLEKICLETDSPFLSPQSKRGQRNEPANINEIAKLISELTGLSPEQVANQTSDNVKKLLNIPSI